MFAFSFSKAIKPLNTRMSRQGVCLLIRALSGLIALENDSGLLLALAILNNSAPMAE